MKRHVFLFSGQGSHHFQMGRSLFEHDAYFRDAMLQMDGLVKARCGHSVVASLYADHHTRQHSFNRTLLSHPAIFMVEYALAQSLAKADVHADLVLGASLGSFAAAAVAGCVDADAALLAVLEKALILEVHCQAGCMVAVMGEPARYLSPELLELCELAGRNFAQHTVLALPQQNLAAVEAYLRSHDVVFQRLDVSFAFHSRWIDEAMLPYQEFLRTLQIRPATIPILCCASGDILHTLPPNYFWSVTRKAIRFSDTIAYAETQGNYHYIDVGPAGTLATFLKYSLPAGSSSQSYTLMRPFGKEIDHMPAILAQLRSSRLPQTKNLIAPQIASHIASQTEKQYITKGDNRMKVIIFPGQGAQFKGMGKEVFPLYPELVKVASEILGYSIEELCLFDPDGRLGQTQYTQPALYVVNALHYYRYLSSLAEGADKAGALPSFFAGHSLGEYNALLAADVFSFETGLRLVKKRGELMGASRNGSMAAVIGVAAQEVKAILLEQQLALVDIANYNSPTQTVIAGSKEDIAKAAEAFSTRNLRCVVLNVSAAFHSRFMQAAQAEFGQFLQQFSFAAPTTPVIANVTARPYDAAQIAQTLASQIANPVQWVNSIRYLMGKGEIEFQEIGASVLTKMVLEIRAKETAIVEEIAVAPLVKHDLPETNALAKMSDERVLSDVLSDAQLPAQQLVGQVRASSLGSAVFRQRYGLQYAYMAGAMYRGVASAELVIKMGRAGFLSFFGAGGLSPAKIEVEILRIQDALKEGEPYGMNLLANYEYPEQESAVVDLYLKYGIKTVEAAAFMQMTPALVRFRLLGLRLGSSGEIVCDHRIVAKISRPEVAKAFLMPPPMAIVEKLLEQRLISEQQAKLSQKIPVSHDICVEADSGGHTDGGIAAVMLPPLLQMRNEMQARYQYAEPICMGLAGGIGGPEAAAAAFLLGADFVMTGSINQCTVEAGMSADGKAMLQEIDIHDTEYAPAGDMFEIGAQVQVLKRSVFFPARANKLLSLYRHHNSLDEIPERTRRQLETTYFKKSFAEIWQETAAYFQTRGLEHEVAKAEANPKHKMALVFRWYFAYCTRIAMEGKGEDRVNYQIQTGPALGSFNQWVKGTELEHWTKRHVDSIAIKLMHATAEHMTRSFARILAS
ncbi:MAG: ACP S-malonyltransferase [Undibacterium sp.]|nr:ACP S-malonyltransferase [Undibacterium sp.]